MLIKLPDEINNVLLTLDRNGFESYVVGGCVRDSLMGMKPNDYDVTTNALPSEIKKCFSNKKVIETGIKHGTVTVISKGMPVEITTFRVDGEYTDNRHPESVSFTGCLRDDLSRRDFTVNAIAYSPRTGVVDYFEGQKHIKDRLIICVGDADKRFCEDGLRIIRALRFAGVLGFDIGEATGNSIRKNKELLKNISVERIYSELGKLICGKSFADIAEKYRDVLSVCVPGIKNISDDDYKAYLKAIGGMPKNKLCRLGALLCFAFPGDPDSAEAELRGLKAEKKTVSAVRMLVGNFERAIGKDEISVRHLMAEFSPEELDMLLTVKDLCRGERLECVRETVKRLSREGVCTDISDMKLTGADIISLGVPQGRTVGRIMERIYRRVLDGELANEREILLNEAERILSDYR